MKDLFSTARPALLLLLVFSVLTGIAYPALMIGLVGGNRSGATELVGQPVDDPRYFFGRPSALAAKAGAMNSSGTNQGLEAAAPNILDRAKALRELDPGNPAPVPVDLVTASASGLDPHISPAAAYYQVPRVARLRGLPETGIRGLVDDHIEERTLGLLGERRVNVRSLNQALDRM
jgi:K+-transporting ATPase ATPase C chain